MSENKTVRVKKSTLPGAGQGLFAKITFRKGDRITEYKGRRELWKEIKHTDGYNGYLLRLSRTVAINALPNKKTFGRYANDAAGFGKRAGAKNNAEYLIYGDRCYIEATRTIQKGEEIFVGYGREFWKLQKAIRRKGKEKPA